MSELPLIEQAYFDPLVQEQYRVLVRYGIGWIPLIWFKVGFDGSVYLGYSQKYLESLKKGRVLASNGQVSIKYDEGENVPNFEQIPNPSKTSFHTSGAINSLGERIYKSAHNHIAGHELLCFFAFKQPSTMKRILGDDEVEPVDICLNYPIDDERPLFASVYISHVSNENLIQIGAATHQVNLILDYYNLTDCDDLKLSIVFSHGLTGPWPPKTYKVFPFNSDGLHNL